MPKEFEKRKGRVKKDAVYFTGLYAMRAATEDAGVYVILAPDIETVRAVWAFLNPELALDETRVYRIGIFKEEAITDADS
jgi:hypothetical protein